MTQFKVGDIVERNDNLLPGVRAEVSGIEREWLHVRYISGRHAGRYATWPSCRSKLVPAQEECKFQPGKVYKDREGRDYTFILYEEKAAPCYKAIFLTSTGSVTCRYADGILNVSKKTTELDILPNKATRIVNVYRNDYNSLIALNAGAKVPANWKKIGEVVEEYETY